jgi:hypothetical protein
VADGWCWFVLREEYCWLVASGWFVLREKYCWLVADKPSKQGEKRNPFTSFFKTTPKFATKVVWIIILIRFLYMNIIIRG